MLCTFIAIYKSQQTVRKLQPLAKKKKDREKKFGRQFS